MWCKEQAMKMVEPRTALTRRVRRMVKQLNVEIVQYEVFSKLKWSGIALREPSLRKPKSSCKEDCARTLLRSTWLAPHLLPGRPPYVLGALCEPLHFH